GPPSSTTTSRPGALPARRGSTESPSAVSARGSRTLLRDQLLRQAHDAVALGVLVVGQLALQIVEDRVVEALVPRLLARDGQRRARLARLAPGALVPAREDAVQLGQDLVQVVLAGLVAQVVADQGPLALRVIGAQRRQLVPGREDFQVVHGRAGQR